MNIFCFTNAIRNTPVLLILLLYVIGARPIISEINDSFSVRAAEIIVPDKAWIEAEVNHDKQPRSVFRKHSFQRHILQG